MTREELAPLLSQAAQRLRQAGAREVYVFGSAATGRFTEHSDVDLAVSGLPPAIFYQLLSEVTDIIGRSVDLIDLDERTLFSEFLRTEGKLKRVA